MLEALSPVHGFAAPGVLAFIVAGDAGGVWLPLLFPCPVLSLPINSSCGPQRRAGQDMDPLRVNRADIERYVRWLPETRLNQPSTVSRRLAPAESPTLGLGHLQFEALITTARLSPTSTTSP